MERASARESPKSQRALAADPIDDLLISPSSSERAAPGTIPKAPQTLNAAQQSHPPTLIASPPAPTTTIPCASLRLTELEAWGFKCAGLLHCEITPPTAPCPKPCPHLTPLTSATLRPCSRELTMAHPESTATGTTNMDTCVADPTATPIASSILPCNGRQETAGRQRRE